MAARIPDEKRAAILADIRAGQMSCRAIARGHGVSDHAVRKIAKEAGITDAWSRDQTKNATRARVADMSARRAELAERMLNLAEHFASRATSPYTVVIATREEVIHEQLSEPPLPDVQRAMTAVGIAIDKHLALVRHDGDSGGDVDAARSLLSDLGLALGIAADQLGTGPPTPIED